MKASGCNYQLIFMLAAAVSLAACVAFVVFVPAHARTAETAAASTEPSTSSAATEKSTPQTGLRATLSALSSMGLDFYRMLGVICLYAMGHVNESLLEVRSHALYQNCGRAMVRSCHGR
jgi:hypothetical protein